MSNISLTADQKQKLEEIIQSVPELIVHRVRLILAYAEGKPTLQAAMQAGISRGRARFWKRQFLSRGMDIFNIDSNVEIQDKDRIHRLYAVGDNFISEIVPAAKVETGNIPRVELPFPAPQQTIGLKADDSLAEAGRKVWLYHFAIMLSHEQGTLLGEDVEELHDMRVATRRMRTAFDVFGEAFDPKIMKHYLKGLRGIGRALGQVRDMDVLLGKALIFQRGLAEEEHPGLEALIDAWNHMIDKKRNKLIKHLQSEEYENFKRSFNEFLQPHLDNMNSSVLANETTTRIRDIVPILVYSRYAAVRAYEPVLSTATVSQLHALRIEFKKFRYTLEYFKEILGETVGKTINEIKVYQDRLGELHDADVACQLVREFLRSWEEKQAQQPIYARVNPEPVVSYLAYLHAERYRLMVAFPQLWQKFNRTEFSHNLARAISIL